MSSVYKRKGYEGPSDPWYIDLTHPVTRQRIRRFVTGTTDKAVANLILVEEERKLIDPDYAARQERAAAVSVTPGVAATDLYLVQQKRKVAMRTLSPKTYEIDQQKCGNLVALMPPLLADWDRTAFDKYLDARCAQGAKPRTLHMEIRVARAALKLAKKAKLYHLEVEDEVPRVGGEYVMRDRVLAPEEMNWLFQTIVSGNRGPSPEAHRLNRGAALIFAVITGMRKSELRKACLEHVDLAGMRVFVDGAKTTSSRGWIAIPEEWRHLLQAVVWAVIGAGIPPHQPMFPHGKNLYRTLEHFSKRMSKRVTMNDLRRTMATWLLASGTSETAVWKQLRHTGPTMLAKHYGKLTAAMLQDLVNAHTRPLPQPVALPPKAGT